MGNDSGLVSTRVPQAQKKRWESYVEETDNLMNMSQLIRTAVERYIQDSQADSFYSKEEHLKAEQMEQIETKLQEIEDNIGQVNKRIDG